MKMNGAISVEKYILWLLYSKQYPKIKLMQKNTLLCNWPRVFDVNFSSVLLLIHYMVNKLYRSETVE